MQNTNSSKAGERTQFVSGDLLTIHGHTSAPGKGLTYGPQFVIVQEDGASGGWDVYDGISTDGQEVSFYGHSITSRTCERLAKLRA